MSLLLILFLKITRREFNNEYTRFLNLRHLDSILVCVFSPWLNNYSFSSYDLKGGMWSSGIGKNGSKRVNNFFQNNLEKRIKMEREREWTHTKRFKVKMFFSSLKIFIPLLWETFGALFFLSFSARSLYFGILKIFEEKTNFKLFFGWDGSAYTMNMKVEELQIY
jgi:hypothetical protein